MTKLLPSSLTNRLVAATVALVVVVTVLVALVAALVMRSYLTGQLDNQLAESMSRAQNAVRGNGPPGFDDDSGCLRLPLGQQAGSITATFSTTCEVGQQITATGARTAVGRDLGELGTSIARQVASLTRGGDLLSDLARRAERRGDASGLLAQGET
ncbi:MAG: hypothetical protein EON52_21220, partial [Actinomycetales bacterium]